MVRMMRFIKKIYIFRFLRLFPTKDRVSSRLIQKEVMDCRRKLKRECFFIM